MCVRACVERESVCVCVCVCFKLHFSMHYSMIFLGSGSRVGTIGEVSERVTAV